MKLLSLFEMTDPPIYDDFNIEWQYKFLQFRLEIETKWKQGPRRQRPMAKQILNNAYYWYKLLLLAIILKVLENYLFLYTDTIVITVSVTYNFHVCSLGCLSEGCVTRCILLLSWRGSVRMGLPSVFYYSDASEYASNMF